MFLLLKWKLVPKTDVNLLVMQYKNISFSIDHITKQIESIVFKMGHGSPRKVGNPWVGLLYSMSDKEECTSVAKTWN